MLLKKIAFVLSVDILALLIAISPVQSQEEAACRSALKAASGGSVEKAREQSNQQDVDFGPYMAALQRQIKDCWHPPTAGETARVVVVFKIHEEGELSDLRLDKSSGSYPADEAALLAVLKAAPFSQLPVHTFADIDVEFTFDEIVSKISWQEVIKDQTRAINCNSKNALALRLRGEAYSGLGEYQKAAGDYNKAMRLEPKNGQLYIDRGCAYDELGQHKQAIKDFDKAITFAPRNTLPYINRGKVYGNLGDHRQAIKDFSKAIFLEPKDADTYGIRATVYQELGQLKEAINDYNTALILNPKLSANNLAIFKEALEKNKQAKADFDKFIAAAPNNAAAYYVRGLHYAGCSQQWKAVADYNQALTLNPFLLEAYIKRADAFSCLGRYDLAVADQTIAIRLAPGDATVYSNRGSEHAELEEWQSAIDDFTKAFRLDPINAGCNGVWGWQSVQFSDKAKYFYVDKTGKRVGRQTFDDAGSYSEGLAAVKIGESYGYIDKTGTVAIKPHYVSAHEFHEELALVTPVAAQGTEHSHELGGFIDKSGKLVINLTDSHAWEIEDDSHFSEGLAPIFIGCRYGFIDRRGVVVIPPLFETARSFSDGLAVVKMAGQYGFIDKTGKLVIQPQFDLVGDFSEGLAPVLRLSHSRLILRAPHDKNQFFSLADHEFSGSTYGFIDRNGDWVIQPQFEVCDLQNHMNGIESFDTVGRPIWKVSLLSRQPFNNIRFTEGVASVWRRGKYGLIDTVGTIVVEPKFDRIGPFSGGLAPALINSHYGFIDKSGKFVIKQQFDVARQFSENIAAVGISTQNLHFQRERNHSLPHSPK